MGLRAIAYTIDSVISIALMSISFFGIVLAVLVSGGEELTGAGVAVVVVSMLPPPRRACPTQRFTTGPSRPLAACLAHASVGGEALRVAASCGHRLFRAGRPGPHHLRLARSS